MIFSCVRGAVRARRSPKRFKESGSFLKKRTKKLLLRCRADMATTRPIPAAQN
jgi:hypothetical protein